MGWVDKSALWCLDVNSRTHRSLPIGDARYLQPRIGRNRFFAVIHHYEGEKLVISAHSFESPQELLSTCVISARERSITGDVSVWCHVPRYYVAYLTLPCAADFTLVDIDRGRAISLQNFEWYDDHYDKGYQGITGVTEVPGSHLLIVSVQRDSHPVLYDPIERRKMGEIVLGGNYGNPRLTFSKDHRSIWADDYDTILRLDPQTWTVVVSRHLQPAAAGTAQFIGEYAFDVEESLCVIARPFSGDVVGLDPITLELRYRSPLGNQPLEVAALSGHRVISRDWKSGSLLEGRLSPV